MIGLIAWIVAVVVALVILGIVGFDLAGKVNRVLRAMAVARTDVERRVDRVLAEPSAGRHSLATMAALGGKHSAGSRRVDDLLSTTDGQS